MVLSRISVQTVPLTYQGSKKLRNKGTLLLIIKVDRSRKCSLMIVLEDRDRGPFE